MKKLRAPYPVRTMVGSDLDHSPGMLIEIDCIARMSISNARSARSALSLVGSAGARRVRGLLRSKAAPRAHFLKILSQALQ